MPWLRFDDLTADHPKFAALGDFAPLCGWLWFSACCYSMRYLTNGRIELVNLRKLWPFQHIGIATGGNELFETGDDPTADDLVARLVNVRLLDEIEPGVFRIHDFLKYNPSKAQVLRARKRNAQHQQAFRERTRKDLTKDGSKAPVRMPPSPSPTPKETTSKKTRSHDSRHLRPTAISASVQSVLNAIQQRHPELGKPEA